MPPVEQLRGRQLGRILIKMGKLRRQEVQQALDIQKERRGPLGKILVELGHINEEDLQVALAAQCGMEMVDLAKLDASPEAIAMLTAQMANTYQVVPFEYNKERHELSVALGSPDNFLATDDLKTLLGCNIKAFLCGQKQLQTALERFYPEGEQESITGLINELSDDADLAAFQDRGDSIDLAELKEMAELNPVKKLLNLVLLQAIKDKASDIHFEPFEDEFKMRYRIDGVLYEMVPPPRYVSLAIASRIKVMSNLDISERRMPQDGRIQLQLRGAPIDLRVAVLPTMFGESVVLRVLDRSNVQLSLDKIGLRDDDLATFRQLIKKPNGIIVNTGPTGCGKTTTLYAALTELNDPGVKILTAEDPVEYDIDGLVQVQIRPDVGLTFARALRSFLRQDPDIILVGETRDQETAQIAVQASLTGHLVFTTLHTNDAPSSIARLLDMGLEPFLITATLEAIVAQRLVRRICVNCKAEHKPTEEQLMRVSLRPEDVGDRVFYYGKGCDYCNQTGYRGRVGIFEFMVLDDALRELIMRRGSSSVLRREAIKRGMRTLRQSGLLSVYDGITTLDEIGGTTIEEG
ncbi:MAG TPA: ATPase, T2SS/T4P/T4SS family [Phycisphaerae bacterium]|nr:ATPase, T2SS/T4P/T4SS family [Phycisphaerae bacterium]HNU45353.1 ATPase, T2SS/T4P/T4SS family [Phycisphaerae bacterium]